MLPRQHRLNRSADLRHTMRRGRRFVIPQAVVSVLPANTDVSRVGLITPKVVGNSVLRHKTARMIRAGATLFLSENAHRVDVVVRAQAGAAELKPSDWHEILNAACERASL